MKLSKDKMVKEGCSFSCSLFPHKTLLFKTADIELVIQAVVLSKVAFELKFVC